MSVPFLRASSTLSAFIFSTTACTKRSWMPAVAITLDEAVQRCPVKKKAALDRAVHRDFEVCVVEHHQRILAAHLELELLHAGDRRLRHLAADRLRAGEGDRGDARIAE